MLLAVARRARRRRRERDLFAEAEPLVAARMARLVASFESLATTLAIAPQATGPDPVDWVAGEDGMARGDAGLADAAPVPVMAPAPPEPALAEAPVPVMAPAPPEPTPGSAPIWHPIPAASAIVPFDGATTAAVAAPSRPATMRAPARAAAARAAAAPSASWLITAETAALVRPARRGARPARWGSEVRRGRVSSRHDDPRRRMWRDASLALILIAIVGLLIIGANVVRLREASAPTNPLAVAALVANATPKAALDPGAVPTIPVLSSPSPEPTLEPSAGSPGSTPPTTGGVKPPTPPLLVPPSHRPPPGPTPTPKPTPTPPPPVASFVPPSPLSILPNVLLPFTNTSTPGSTPYWYVDDVLVATSWDLAWAFEVGDHKVELVVTKAGRSDFAIDWIKVD